MKRAMQTITAMLLCCVLAMLCAGCDYYKAVAQNLEWGTSGMISSVLNYGDLRGAGQWITGALVNAAVYGHQ